MGDFAMNFLSCPNDVVSERFAPEESRRRTNGVRSTGSVRAAGLRVRLLRMRKIKTRVLRTPHPIPVAEGWGPPSDVLPLVT